MTFNISRRYVNTFGLRIIALKYLAFFNHIVVWNYSWSQAKNTLFSSWAVTSLTLHIWQTEQKHLKILSESFKPLRFTVSVPKTSFLYV